MNNQSFGIAIPTKKSTDIQSLYVKPSISFELNRSSSATVKAEHILQFPRPSLPDVVHDPEPDLFQPVVKPVDPNPDSYRLLVLGEDSAELYRHKNGLSYLLIQSQEQTYRIPLDSKTGIQAFEYYLKKTNKHLNEKQIKAAFRHYAIMARYEGKLIESDARIVREGNSIYYDLGSDNALLLSDCVAIDDRGWRIVKNDQPRFQTFETQDTQVIPQRGGSLDLLDKYLNLKPDQLLLLKAYLVSCFIPGYPHPILQLDGEAGSSKTTTSKILKSLIDPSKIKLQDMSAKQDDLTQNLDHNYFPAFDNVSEIKPMVSDTLCRAVTGEGIEVRMLYSNGDSYVRFYRRSVLINFISIDAQKEDILSRSLMIRLEPIEEDKRKTEEQFWPEFNLDKPFILGAIFDAASQALQIYPTLKLDNLPRMADFQKWGYACALAIDEKSGQEFLDLCAKNVVKQREETIDSNPFLMAMLYYRDEHPNASWRGTTADFLGILESIARSEKLDMLSRFWPKDSVRLAKAINNHFSQFSKLGIQIDKEPRKGNERIILIKTTQV